MPITYFSVENNGTPPPLHCSQQTFWPLFLFIVPYLGADGPLRPNRRKFDILRRRSTGSSDSTGYPLSSSPRLPNRMKFRTGPPVARLPNRIKFRTGPPVDRFPNRIKLRTGPVCLFPNRMKFLVCPVYRWFSRLPNRIKFRAARFSWKVNVICWWCTVERYF